MFKICPTCKNQMVIIDVIDDTYFERFIDIYGCETCGYREDEEE